MNEFSLQEKMPQEIVSICAMNAVLHTTGVAEMAPLPAMASIGKEKDGAKGIKIADTKKGLEIDVYLNVSFGANIPDTAWNIQENVKHRVEDFTDRKVSQVNIHIMGVSPNGAKGNEQNR